MSFWSKLLGLFQPSDALKQQLRKLQQKRRNTYYEGPKAPVRIREEIRLFSIANIGATPEEWAKFTESIACHSYEDGFTRGYEWLQRGWDRKPDATLERVAEAERHDWSLAEADPRYDKLLTTGYMENDPLAGVPFEERRAFMEMISKVGNGPYAIYQNIDAYAPPPDIEEED